MKTKVSPLEIRQIMAEKKKQIVRKELIVRFRDVKTGQFVKDEAPKVKP